MQTKYVHLFPAIFDWSFGRGFRTSNLGEEGVYGVGSGTVRKSVGGFLGPP